MIWELDSMNGREMQMRWRRVGWDGDGVWKWEAWELEVGAAVTRARPGVLATMEDDDAPDVLVPRGTCDPIFLAHRRMQGRVASHAKSAMSLRCLKVRGFRRIEVLYEIVSYICMQQALSTLGSSTIHLVFHTVPSGSSVYPEACAACASCSLRASSRSAAHSAELVAAVKRNNMLNGGTSCRNKYTVPYLRGMLATAAR
jgi:hypothetical protein